MITGTCAIVSPRMFKNPRRSYAKTPRVSFSAAARFGGYAHDLIHQQPDASIRPVSVTYTRVRLLISSISIYFSKSKRYPTGHLLKLHLCEITR
jgi:hypothetical protein